MESHEKQYRQRKEPSIHTLPVGSNGSDATAYKESSKTESSIKDANERIVHLGANNGKNGMRLASGAGSEEVLFFDPGFEQGWQDVDWTNVVVFIAKMFKELQQSSSLGHPAPDEWPSETPPDLHLVSDKVVVGEVKFARTVRGTDAPLGIPGKSMIFDNCEFIDVRTKSRFTAPAFVVNSSEKSTCGLRPEAPQSSILFAEAAFENRGGRVDAIAMEDVTFVFDQKFVEKHGLVNRFVAENPNRKWVSTRLDKGQRMKIMGAHMCDFDERMLSDPDKLDGGGLSSGVLDDKRSAAVDGEQLMVRLPQIVDNASTVRYSLRLKQGRFEYRQVVTLSIERFPDGSGVYVPSSTRPTLMRGDSSAGFRGFALS